MKPLQKPMPPIWIAASSDETLIKAGQLGWPMMGIPFARSNNIADVKTKNDLYLDSYRKAGHPGVPEIMVALHVYLHPDKNEAVGLSRPYFQRAISFHKTHRRPGSKIPDFDIIKKERLAIFSCPEDAAAIVREYEKIGVTQVIGMVNFGGAPMPEVRKTMEIMSNEVFPHLR